MSTRKRSRVGAFVTSIGVSLTLLVPTPTARASFSVSDFFASIIHPTTWDGDQLQGMPVWFHSHHAGKISHYRAAVGESCTIRAVLGYTDPPGHPIDPVHVVKERYAAASFPPGVDGELVFGSLGAPVELDDNVAVDWTCNHNTGDHFTSWAKTTFTLNGGTPTTGDYSWANFHSVP